MEKIRVYELAKDLNTTSKRLMEKLAEVDVVVKNHMSFLEDHELASLYKHIGVVKHEDGKKSEEKKLDEKRHEAEEKKALPVQQHTQAAPPAQSVPPQPQQKQEARKEPKKDVKSAPRIIRTTEVVINTKNETKEPVQPQRADGQRGDVRGNVRHDNSRRDMVRTADANSGLRAGFVRDNRQDLFRDNKNYQRNDYNKEAPKEQIVRDVVKTPAAETPKETVKDIVIDNLKPEVIQEQNREIKQEMNQDIKPQQLNKTEEVHQEKNESSKPVSGESNQQEKSVEQKGEAATKPESGATNDDLKQQTRPQQDRGGYNQYPRGSGDRRPDGNYQDRRGSQQGDRPQGDRPQGDRPQGDRPQGDRPQGDRPQGDRFSGNRPQGDRPQGDRFGGNRPQGDRPQGGYSDRPQGDRPQGGYGNRPQGDRPQGGYGNRPQGDRPQGGYGDRPQGDRPQGGYGDRPQGDRPQGGYGDRPQGDRPQGGYGDRPQGDRPQGGYGDRPQGGYNNRPQGDRPQGGYNNNRPQGDRPQGGYGAGRPQGDRPQGGYGAGRPQGDRPQGGYGDRPQGGYNNRPQGDRPQGGYSGGRPQGDRPQGGYGGGRPQGDRPQGGYGDRSQGGYGGGRPQGGGGFRPGQRSMDVPKVELSEAQKEEMNSQKSEIRREFSTKDIDKDAKREQKRDIPKTAPVNKTNKRFKPQTVVLNEKKGVHEVLSEDFILQEFYDNDDDRKTKKGSRPRKDARGMAKHIPPKAVLTSVTLPETITVKDLSETLKKTSTEVIKKLMVLGLMATLNQEIDFETATIVAEEFGVKTEKQIVVNEEDILFDDADENEEDKLVTRPPVVVVMGHVDHGKTSLLDAIRSANVTDSEAGGITQHIGAYTVKINGRNITFLDTPGHEAFTAMRARGAQVTDIAILVVAADDGVMPQTIEAINHAKAANVSIIVAINKMDKPGANPERVKQELTEHGLVAEEWGGDLICVPVSAKKRENIDHLLEMVLLAADMLELKANPDKQAKGTVIEAKLDTNRGSLATVLVQRGTLNVGDSIVTGTTVGRIRAMTDDKGNSVKSAGPSTPVEILGMPEVPEAGELFYAIKDEKIARQLAEKRKFKQREQTLKSSARVSLDDLYAQIKAGKVKDLNIIVKADVQGSVEAVKQSLLKLTTDEVRVKIIHDAVGAITESDVTLAQVSNAIIIGFNVRPASNVAEIAEAAAVDLRLYSIIYNAIEDVQAAMKGMLEPTFKEVILGHTEVRQIFKVSGVGTIGGAYVIDGKITRSSEVRLLRDNIVIHTGKLASLKRFKDDAREVAQGYECGVSIEKFNDLKEGDIVEAFIMEEVAR